LAKFFRAIYNVSIMPRVLSSLRKSMRKSLGAANTANIQ